MKNHVTPEELLKLSEHITVDELNTIIQAANMQAANRKKHIDFLDAYLIAYTYGKVNAIREMRQLYGHTHK